MLCGCGVEESFIINKSNNIIILRCVSIIDRKGQYKDDESGIKKIEN